MLFLSWFLATLTLWIPRDAAAAAADDSLAIARYRYVRSSLEVRTSRERGSAAAACRKCTRVVRTNPVAKLCSSPYSTTTNP